MEKSETILWVGKLPRDITQTELQKEFQRFGKILEISMRNGYAFVEFDSAKDAKTAQSEMDGYKFDRFPIAVSFKEDRKRGTGRGGPTATDICFNCGKQGHWANECRENDWRKSSRKCRFCGKFGHSERDCRYRSSSRSSSRSYSRRSSSQNKHQKRKYRHSRHSSSPSRSSSRSQKKQFNLFLFINLGKRMDTESAPQEADLWAK